MNSEGQINVKALKEKHRVMEKLPHTTTSSLTGNFSGKSIGQEKVPTERIIATPRLRNWADEYHKDWGKGELTSVENLSVQINKEGDEFWGKTRTQQQQQPIKLTKISGPKGPIYAVEDGSHRVAAAKLAGVSEIPAEVEDLTNRREFSTSDEIDQKSWWEALIYRGAIKGKIEKRGPNYHLTLEETSELPWVLQGRDRFVNTNRVYQQVYGEEALTEVKSVPQEILHDRGKAEVWRNTAIREMREKEAAKTRYKPEEKPKEAPLAVKIGKAQGEALFRSPVKPAPLEPRREPVPTIIQGVSRPPGMGRIKSFFFQRAVQPIIARLEKTAIGKSISTGIRYLSKEGVKKAVGEGIKKGITWLATKFGASAILSALGTAAGPIGTAIGFVAGFLIDKAKGIISGILQKIKKPEVALALGLGGAFFVFGIPGVIGLALGLPLLALGGAGFAAGAGGLLGGFATGVAAFFVALAAPFAAPIGLLIGGIIGGLAIITFFIVMLTASAFIIPAKPLEEVSAYFKVNKTVSRTEIPNNDELQNNPKVTYRISVTAQQPIAITGVRDERTVSCKNPPGPNVQTPIDIDHPTDQIKSWTSDPYELSFDSSFKDCRVCNTVTVIANIEGVASGEMATDTQCVKIGNPPEDCPSGWPTANGYITQGPHGSFSHLNQEAIDIGVPAGTPVKSTHEGTVVEASWGTGTIKVQGICGGKTFTTLYLHLQSKAVKTGDKVSPGNLIGTSGVGGTGAHLHYEFDGLEMASPYIPIKDDFLEGCVFVATCKTQW